MRLPSALALAASPRHCYVHLPFCRRRCFYCDFPVVVAGDEVKGDRIADYISLLERELNAQAPTKQPLATVYLGGGTP